jgi:foldase protein PrsA
MLWEDKRMSFKKRVLAASLAAVMTLGMTTGCTTVRKSDLSDDLSTVVAATYGDEKIYLDEVNYYLRNSQLSYEYFGTMYGINIWDSEGMEDNVREEAMSIIYQTRVLCAHADDYNVELTDADKELVAEAVSELLEDESNQAFMEIAGSDEEMLTEIMTQNALANKVYQAICDETEITTTEEDVRKNSVSYLLFNEETESEDETETAEDETADAETEETEEAVYYTEDDANAALEKVQAGTSLEEVGEEVGIDVSTTNFSVNEEQSTDFAKAGAALAEGESTVVYEEGTGWYVMVCDSDNDEDATASAYESAVETEKSDHFSEVYEAMDKAKFKVNEDVVNTLNIADTPVFNIETEADDETEEATDSVEDETAEADTTEAESETETTQAE